MPIWLRISIAAAATLLLGMGLGRFSYAPMVPALIGAGALSADEAGWVGALNLAGYMLGGLVTLWLRARWPERYVLRGCMVIAELCLIASILPLGFTWLAVWRTLVGVVVAAMMILSIAAVTRSAPADRRGRAAGIAFTGVGLGILLSAAGLPVLLPVSLEAAWAGAAAVGAAGLAVGWWGWGAASDQPAEPLPPLRLRAIDGNGWRLVLAQTLFSLGLVPHSIWWVDFVVRGTGASLGEGSRQWILVGLGAVLGTFAFGRVADRIGFTRGLVLVFAWLAAGIALPMLVTTEATIIASSLMFGAQPGLSAVIAARAQQAMGAASMVGLWRWMVLAVGLGQLAGGPLLVWLFNATGDYRPVFLMGAAAMALGAVLSAGLKERAAVG